MIELPVVLGPWCHRCDRLMETVEEKKNPKTGKITRTFQCPKCKDKETF